MGHVPVPWLRFVIIKHPLLQPSCFLANLKRREPFKRRNQLSAEFGIATEDINAGDAVGEEFMDNLQVHCCSVGKEGARAVRFQETVFR